MYSNYRDIRDPQRDPQRVEMDRLRDLLPASLRSLVVIESVALPENLPLRLKRGQPWQPIGYIQLNMNRWLRIPQPQRDLLFLREVGWFDSRNWLQPGFYQVIAVVGLLSTLTELALQNPYSALLAGGVTTLAVNQIRQNLNKESLQFEADEFALRRAQYRGYDRQAAARHLIEALETLSKQDPEDITTAIRLQRLKAIARTGQPSHRSEPSSGDSR
jgi:hypothetical protein